MASFNNPIGSLTKDEVLNQPVAVRLAWFSQLYFKHRNLLEVAQSLQHILHATSETRITVLVGPTGIGKTAFCKRVLCQQLMATWKDSLLPSDAPLLFIAAPANGERSLSWRTLYARLLEAGNEILIDEKRSTTVTEARHVVGRGKATVAALRESVESMIRHRNVRLIVIDEAVHLLRFEEHMAVMDTLKSLADVHQAKLLLLGSYDLIALMTQYGQVARRSEILHMPRYRNDGGEVDRKEFAILVGKFQEFWPAKEVPDLLSITTELMEATLGSVGLLKALMQSALTFQLQAPHEVWKPAYLLRSAKSNGSLRCIQKETIDGEEALAGLVYGDNVFADKAFMQRVITKMSARSA